MPRCPPAAKPNLPLPIYTPLMMTGWGDNGDPATTNKGMDVLQEVRLIGCLVEVACCLGAGCCALPPAAAGPAGGRAGPTVSPGPAATGPALGVRPPAGAPETWRRHRPPTWARPCCRLNMLCAPPGLPLPRPQVFFRLQPYLTCQSFYQMPGYSNFFTNTLLCAGERAAGVRRRRASARRGGRGPPAGRPPWERRQAARGATGAMRRQARRGGRGWAAGRRLTRRPLPSRRLSKLWMPPATAPAPAGNQPFYLEDACKGDSGGAL